MILAYDVTTVSARPSDLPSFDRPPVTEVLLSIQFDALSFAAVHIGPLWQQYRDRYPVVTEQAAVEPVFETFGGPQQQGGEFRFEQLARFPLPRMWFEASNGDLIQIQKDRFIHNWRKREASQEYPRYEQVRAQFVSEFETFSAFVRENELGELRPNQIEIGYINLIDLPDGANPHNSISRIFKTGPAAEEFGELEDITFRTRSILRTDGKPVGRLVVNLQPVHRISTNAAALRLEMVVRGKPDQPTLASALDFLDRGRETIVRTFAGITTPEMHAHWERQK